MKTISRYIMTLALLLTAVGGAWAQTPTIYFQQDYSTETVDWSTATSGRFTPIIEDGYLTVNQGQRQNNGTTLTCTATQGKVDAGKDFTMTFNVKLGASTNQSATAFNIYDASNSGLILSLAEGSVNATAWTINRGTQTATVSAGGGKSLDELSWIFVQVTYIAGENAKTYLTLKDEQNNIIDGFDQTEIPTLSEAGGLGKMTFVTSRYLANFAIDNVLVCDVEDDAPAGPEVTLNDDKSEASFKMPQYDVTATYTLKRDMTVDVAGEMADLIRIQMVGNAFQAVDATQMNPVVKDNLETNSPVTLTVTTDYTLQLQKQDETDPDTWTDVTALSVGTFRYKITGAGNYSGICYSEEFALFQGYEITVGAGEYATFYKDENLYTEDVDAELYTITEVTATEAVLSDKIDVVPSETPMLIYNKSEQDKIFLLIPTTEQAADVTAADQFQGTLEAKTFSADDMKAADYYVCTGNAFVWVKSAGTIAANRCWLEILAQNAGARANTRSIVSGGDTTNIDATTRDALEGDYYDLQGRKVEKPLRKGIYIKSGKKVIKH